MEIELYLDRINQEMINKNIKKSPDQQVPGVIKEVDNRLQGIGLSEWGGNVWNKTCCICNCFKVDSEIRYFEELGPFITMRREKFGGLVWDQDTGAVYKLDEEAFMIINDLDNGVSVKKAAETANVSEKAVKSLIIKMRKLKKRQ